MKSKRLTWLLAGTCALLLAGLLASWLVPYSRERGVIAEFERMGMPVFDHWPPFVSSYIGGICVEKRGPEWLRRIVGDDWMGPFDRVTHVDVGLFFSFATRSEAEDVFRCLRSFRNIDRLTIGEGLLTEEEVAILRSRFPGMEFVQYPWGPIPDAAGAHG
ncbi:MAG: hypothetical protein WD066_13775 [Planctomycetaceae bacterium]